MIEWSHAIYTLWAACAQQQGENIEGGITDEARWPTERLPPFLETVCGEAIPESGRPPRIPWDGQRAAAARV
eukprot:893479-Pyramimonas_sp.AAC.1